MYCSCCGKQIPEESVFCMYCGKQLEYKPLSDNPPIATGKISLVATGPTEVTPGKLFAGKIGRGFRMRIWLVDAYNEWTASDGEVCIAFRFYGSPIAAHVFNSDQRTLDRLKRAGEIYKIMPVKKADFKWEKFVRSGHESLELCYSYAQLSPILYTTEGYWANLYVWFKTPNGTLFFKDGETEKWE